MTKQELLKYLEPFMDETEVVVKAEADLYGFRLEYESDGYGVNQDTAAIVIRLIT